MLKTTELAQSPPEKTSYNGRTFGRRPLRTRASVPVVGEAVQDGVPQFDVDTSLPCFGKLCEIGRTGMDADNWRQWWCLGSGCG